jgi:hypothetical protein
LILKEIKSLTQVHSLRYLDPSTKEPCQVPNRVDIKIQKIARWRVAGLSDRKIASLLGMSPDGLHRLTSTPEYKEFETTYLEGHLTQMDEALAGHVDAIREQFRVAVPAAMRTLVEAVTQKRDLRAALEAAKEILERDPDRVLSKRPVQGTEEFGLPAEIVESAASEGNKIN